MGRTPNRLPNYLLGSDINEFTLQPDYIIWKAGTTIKALKTSTGSILSYGTDFYTQVMACHTDTNADRGAVLHIRTGAYTLNTGFNFTKPFCITGCGGCWIMGTVITSKASLDEDMICYDGAGDTIYMPILSNFSLNGNDANNAQGNGIYFKADCCDPIVHTVGVGYSANHGIRSACARTHILNCWIEYSKLDNLYLGGGGDQIIGCHLSYAGRSGISATAATMVSNCYIGYNNNNAANFEGNDLSYMISNCEIVLNSQAGAGTSSALRCDTGHLLATNNNISGTNHKYAVELAANSHDSRIQGNYIGAYNTGPYSDLGTRNLIDGMGAESANAETPQDPLWRTGSFVQFTDTGDATGNGLYVLNKAGNWIKIS